MLSLSQFENGQGQPTSLQLFPKRLVKYLPHIIKFLPVSRISRLPVGHVGRSEIAQTFRIVSFCLALFAAVPPWCSIAVTQWLDDLALKPNQKLKKKMVALIKELNRHKELAPVVQTLDNAIHRINHYPADKYYGSQLLYPLDSDLSGG